MIRFLHLWKFKSIIFFWGDAFPFFWKHTVFSQPLSKTDQRQVDGYKVYSLATSPSITKIQRDFLLEQHRWVLVLTHPHLSAGIPTEKSSSSLPVTDFFLKSGRLVLPVLFAFLTGGYCCYYNYSINFPIITANICLLFNCHACFNSNTIAHPSQNFFSGFPLD